MSTTEDSDTPELHRAPAADIEDVRVEDEMEQSYIDYSMSVIAGRALPDVRDGLKPVQRRILYAMDEMGLTHSGSHRKSSSIVGETMGNYHPHGDSAIYAALVRMAQDFSLRNPLVDGQGNFGSIDGDPPAAMRYTEARPESITSDLLDDIDKDTVDWSQNYDDRLEEPDVLPAAFPQLLVNGASGIAVGMSTNMPPHNLREVIDATLHLIDNPDADSRDLMQFVKGPDFPTGATIVGRKGIEDAYTTGRGRVRIRANYETDPDENRIVITEIPFQQDKSKLVEKIASYVKEGTIEGIRDLRDESDQHGVRIVLDLKRDAIIDVVENQLIQHVLEKTFGVINLALVDGQPQVLTLCGLLEEYLSHRREVVRRRTNYLLEEAEDRSHILEGRLVAVENAESVIELIQDAADRSAAKLALEDEYDMSEEQAQHVVRMQLGSLTSAEVGEIEEEHEQVQADIERYEEILGDDDVLDTVIKNELQDIKERYGDERRTNIIEDTGSVTNEDLIPEEDILLALSESGYVKRMSQDVVDAQGRGGKGVIGADLRGGDTIKMLHATSTHDHLLFFTNHGNVHFAKGYEMNEVSRTARGTPLINHFDLDGGEEITAVTSVDSFEDAEGKSLVIATKGGYVKRTALEEYSSLRSTGLRAATLDGGDEIVAARVIDGDADLMLATTAGKTIRFPPEDVREMGRTSRGVNGIKLPGGTEVVSLTEASDDETLFTICENGYGKRTEFAEYSQQSRYGQGIIDIKTEGRNGPVVATRNVTDEDDIVLMTEKGQLIRVDASDISVVSRNTMGVTIMNLEGDDLVGAVAVIESEEEDETDDE